MSGYGWFVNVFARTSRGRPCGPFGRGGGGIMDWAAWPKLQLGNGLFEDGELGRGYVRLNKDASRLLREFPEPLMSGLVYC